MYRYALTTYDNPFHPIDQWDDWLNFDIQHHYGTSEYLARIAMISPELSDAENYREEERAIDEIIKNDVEHLYVKVKKEIKEV